MMVIMVVVCVAMFVATTSTRTAKQGIGDLQQLDEEDTDQKGNTHHI